MDFSWAETFRMQKKNRQISRLAISNEINWKFFREFKIRFVFV